MTPVVVEKPYITIDSKGKYSLAIPSARRDSSGVEWATPAVMVDFSSVYVARASTSTADINSKLAACYHVVITPGIYHLDAALHVQCDGQVLLGLGLATLVNTGSSPDLLKFERQKIGKFGRYFGDFGFSR